MNCFKAARVAAGLTQVELSKKIHVSQGSISQWETGATCPDIKTLILLADIYGISVDELLMHDSPAIMPRAPQPPQPNADLLERINRLTPENLAFVRKQVDLLLAQQADEKEASAV